MCYITFAVNTSPRKLKTLGSSLSGLPFETFHRLGAAKQMQGGIRLSFETIVEYESPELSHVCKFKLYIPGKSLKSGRVAQRHS